VGKFSPIAHNSPIVINGEYSRVLKNQMVKEFKFLMKKWIWKLDPLHFSRKNVGWNWVLKTYYKMIEYVEIYKEGLVTNRYSQQEGIDF
jgi:hypothetical protein